MSNQVKAIREKTDVAQRGRTPASSCNTSSLLGLQPDSPRCRSQFASPTVMRANFLKQISLNTRTHAIGSVSLEKALRHGYHTLYHPCCLPKTSILPWEELSAESHPCTTPEPSTYNRHYSIESDSILHKALHGGPFKLTAQHVFWRRGSLLFRLKPNLFLPHLQHGSENQGLDDHSELQTNRLLPSCPWLATGSNCP